MVFSDADPSIGISSILSRYASASSAPPPTSTNSRPLPPRAPPKKPELATTSSNGAIPSRPTTTTTSTSNAMNYSRPPFPGSKATSSTNNVRLAGATGMTTSATSSKTDAGAVLKKRKIEETSTSIVGAGNADKRKEMLAKMQARKDGNGISGRSTNSIAASSSTNGASKPKIAVVTGKPAGSMSTGTTPTSAGAPKKSSYKEMLQAAAQAQAEKKHIPGTITHKARPAVVEKKAWQKKLAEQQQQAKTGGDRISKSPGVASGGEKGSAATKKSTEPAKGIPAKQGVGGTAAEGRKLSVGGSNGASATSKTKVLDKSKSAVETGVKRKRLGERSTPPKASYKPGYGSSTVRKGAASKYDKYSNEYEVDGFVVDDEDERPGYLSKRYTYYESDYDSGSDMEATGADIFEEEERSRRTAIKEDLEQEKLEKQLAAQKAAMKKKLVKK
ncbi:hypothetical protein RUND412_009470 [Rhizina undulata]